MAVVTLDRVWINRLDTGEAISAQTKPGRERHRAAQGQVRRYAGGRLRSLTLEGLEGEFRATLRMVSLATVAKLESWAELGLAVQVRDHRGQRFQAVFFEVPVVEYRGAVALYDVALTFRFITMPDGV